MKINWKKGLFSTAYRLFSDGREVGYLKERFWSGKTEGTLNEEKASFVKQGLFSNKVDIIAPDTQKKLGQIEMNTWRNKASITLSGEPFNWRFINFWNTRWQLLDGETPIIEHKSRTFAGEAESQTEDNLMMLAGLFVFNQWSNAMGAIRIR